MNLETSDFNNIDFFKKTYVFDNVEVKPTGRYATKTIKLTSKQVTDILIEIQPIDQTGIQWKKWVKINDLYLINDTFQQQDLLLS